MKPTLRDVSQALRYWPVIMTVALFAAIAKPLSPQTRKAAAGEALPLPVACQNLARSSRRIADLLTTVAGNPTAEAYNTLGALFAQQSKLECAIPAFEQALDLGVIVREHLDRVHLRSLLVLYLRWGLHRPLGSC